MEVLYESCKEDMNDLCICGHRRSQHKKLVSNSQGYVVQDCSCQYSDDYIIGFVRQYNPCHCKKFTKK